MEIQLSVRSLVEFILREGDLDNRRGAAPENAMLEGGRIHRMIQRGMSQEYRAEVALCYRESTPDYALVIDGRADGIITQRIAGRMLPSGKGAIGGPGCGPAGDQEGGPGGEPEPEVTVDEIKGVYRSLDKIKKAVPVHLAQAKCYAYIYALQNRLKNIRVRMTYCNIDTEELKYFHHEYDFPELENWFRDLISQFRRWADYACEWKRRRQKSIKGLPFPYEYREGQKELATYVYRTIYHKKKLYIEAPTGVGKTLSTVYPSVMAMGEGLADKIFYLTAKTITRTVASDTFALLKKEGLLLKTLVLTAKEKICFREEGKPECNPLQCPYAKGHYDRINEAVYDMLTNSDNFNREELEGYARKHRVCPFEMGLDMSLFADAVICDYNYLFDPHVYLKRFFAEGKRPDYIFLVDEAHNLVERGREMYSAVLSKEDFLKLKKSVRPYDTKMEKQLEKCNHELLLMKRCCEDYCLVESIESFAAALERLGTTMEKYLEDHEDGEVREEILDFYFEVSHFLYIHDRLDDNYVIYSQTEQDGSFRLKLFCVNPSVNLQECMGKGRSTILFSATLLPIRYYKGLLGAEEGDYEVYAHSVFDPEKRALFIGGDVTSRYASRSLEQYYNIAAYIHEIVKNRHGNYMVFLPSHAFLQEVYQAYASHFMEENEVECILQEERMDEQSREAFLGRFAAEESCALSVLIDMEVEVEDKSLIGFCVLGGIFSEGIDLKNDRLIGAVIVGTGLPQVCAEREILKKYFDNAGENGFDYAYRYPGMNKVLQAAGRVIRTAQDVGVVALLDVRFLDRSYRRLFPREWEHMEAVNVGQIAKRVERFWDEWL